MSKEFQKKFVHPTRRKLIDMVYTGEYESNPNVGYTPSNTTEIREVGERWVDGNGDEWEQRNGYKIKVNKLTELMSKVRDDMIKKSRCKLYESGCNLTGKISYTNKKLIEKTGYCSNCLAHLEHPIRMDGLYTAYENFKIMSNMIKEGSMLIEQLQQAYNETKQQYEYVDSDGNVQTWTMERDVDDLKNEIKKDIESIKSEIVNVIQNRQKVYDLLKDKNYVLVNEIMEHTK